MKNLLKKMHTINVTKNIWLADSFYTKEIFFLVFSSYNTEKPKKIKLMFQIFLKNKYLV